MGRVPVTIRGFFLVVLWACQCGVGDRCLAAGMDKQGGAELSIERRGAAAWHRAGPQAEKSLLRTPAKGSGRSGPLASVPPERY